MGTVAATFYYSDNATPDSWTSQRFLEYKVTDSITARCKVLEVFISDPKNQLASNFFAYQRVKITEGFTGDDNITFLGRIEEIAPIFDQRYGQALKITCFDYLQESLHRFMNTNYSTSRFRSALIRKALSDYMYSGSVTPLIETSGSSSTVTSNVIDTDIPLLQFLDDLAREDPWTNATWSEVQDDLGSCWRWNNDGSAYVNNTTEANSVAGTPFALLDDTADYRYIGHINPFRGFYCNVSTAGDYASLSFQYYDNDGNWSTLNTVQAYDFTADGKIYFTPPTDWSPLAFSASAPHSGTPPDTTERYYIRISAGTINTDATIVQFQLIQGYPGGCWRWDETGTVWVDDTSEADSAAGTPFNMFDDDTDDIRYFGHVNPFVGVEFDVDTAGDYGALTWEYWDGDFWVEFTPTTAYTFTADGSMLFDPPANWTAKAFSNGDPHGNDPPDTLPKYWIRVYVASITTDATINQAIPVQGNGYDFYLDESQNFKYFRRGSSGSRDAKWVAPTGNNDPDTEWSNEANAYDEDTATYASNTVAAESWSGYLEFTHAALDSNRMRFYVATSGGTINIIDIDQYDGSDWHDIYSGSFSEDTWTTKRFTYDNITKLRIRFYNAHAADSGEARIKEVDFWDVGEGLIVEYGVDEDDQTRPMTMDYSFPIIPQETITRVTVRGTASDGTDTTSTESDSTLESNLGIVKEHIDFIYGDTTLAECVQKAKALLRERGNSSIQRGTATIPKYPYYYKSSTYTIVHAGDLVRVINTNQGLDEDILVLEITYNEPPGMASLKLLSKSWGRGVINDEVIEAIKKLREGLSIPSAKITSCSISKLTAGELAVQGKIVSNGSFVTGDSGEARIEITDALIVGYNASNVAQFYLDASDGKAYAGAGAVVFDTDGATITDGKFSIKTADSGARIEILNTEIAGYSSGGTKEFYLNVSDGTAYAGAGAVKLDSSGVTIIGQELIFCVTDFSTQRGWILGNADELRIESTNSKNIYLASDNDLTLNADVDVIVDSGVHFYVNTGASGGVSIKAGGAASVATANQMDLVADGDVVFTCDIVDAGACDALQLPLGTSDPTANDGAMYYKTDTDEVMCKVAGVWQAIY